MAKEDDRFVETPCQARPKRFNQMRQSNELRFVETSSAPRKLNETSLNTFWQESRPGTEEIRITSGMRKAE